MACVHAMDACVEDVFWVFLVYSVVCKVHAHFFDVRFCWRFVFLCRKPCKPLLIYIQPHWIRSTKEDIDPKVKFQPLDQKWLV